MKGARNSQYKPPLVCLIKNDLFLIPTILLSVGMNDIYLSIPILPSDCVGLIIVKDEVKESSVLLNVVLIGIHIQCSINFNVALIGIYKHGKIT